MGVQQKRDTKPYRERSAKRDTKKRPRRPGGRNGGSGAKFPTRRPGGIHEMPPVPRGFETPAYWTVKTDRTGWGARTRTWEWRNQNPTNSPFCATAVLKITVNSAPVRSIA